MIPNEHSVSAESLISEVMRKKNEGYRFVTMSSVGLEDGTTDVLYHFDKDMELAHLRFNLPAGEKVPSVSGVYFAALLAENELRDLAGLEFDGLVLDYNRTLLLDPSVETVPLVNNVKIVKKQ
ncbi:NADH-quinone oxidoreductase subunit C [Salidesulfovibrio onnuriiensis]|uniref:NADH-quinone oxidoreductase subunit C n=1 Tax=Salidesulfovibrio onnuriiensis TaxID=2583823 RepID=UPI0011C75B9C|nr:NADH-quinone oxidoreductase subunit C [Salidesulfovibrio onnuriiensis]